MICADLFLPVAEIFVNTHILLIFPVHGGWSDWSSWLPCECENVDEQGRIRKCTNPKPVGELAKSCEGPSSEQRSCTIIPGCSDGK